MSFLINRCAELSVLFSAWTFYIGTTNRGMMEVLQKNKIGLYVTAAPFIDDENAFQTYLLLIGDSTQSTKMLLTFGDKNRLPILVAGLNGTGQL